MTRGLWSAACSRWPAACGLWPFSLAFLAAFAVCLPLKARGERALAWPPPETAEQAAGDEDGLPPGTAFERRREAGGTVIAYTFRNFNEDLLAVKAKIPDEDLEAALAEFGYTEQGLKDVHQRFGRSGAATYERKLREYLAGRGFRLLEGDVVSVDIAKMVARNTPRLNRVARALELVSSSQRYGPEEIVGAATAMVQTAMRYRIPPPQERGRRIGGVHPPVQALVQGWGDCDTKTAVLASLLKNWDGMDAVGVALPRHYLMGLARIPRRGDVFLEHGGSQYVLIESAGPAWLAPGQVGQETLDLLDRMQGVPIQPL